MIRDIVNYIIIKFCGCFDSLYYLHTYPDCRKADQDPLWHFVRYGWKEGRNPSPFFDTRYYIANNPDVRASEVNPLVHYIRYGRKEGRSPNPSSDTFPNNSNIYKKDNTKYDFAWLKNIIYKFGKVVIKAVPNKLRYPVVIWFYTHFGFIFKGTPDYSGWLVNFATSRNISYSPSGLLDLNKVEPILELQGNIAIHLHVFYPDLAKELAERLINVPFPYDLYVSVVSDDAEKLCVSAFSNLPNCQKVVIRQVINRGRDIAPMLCIFRDDLSQYDYIAHIHTKKSLYNMGATGGWRGYLYRSLLGSKDRVRRILALLQDSQPYGIVYPQNYSLLPYWANTWLANKEEGKKLCSMLSIDPMPRGYFDYPAGSMFWARTDALAPLFNTRINVEDFPEEHGQTDGTLAHTLERFLALCVWREGKRPAILRDEENPSWSPWRFEQYIGRDYKSMLEMLSDRKVQVIAFDVFDTLLVRPLLNPETIKRLIARSIGNDRGLLYKEYRDLAEVYARRDSDKDVGLGEIYKYFKKVSKMPQDVLNILMEKEVKIEEGLLEPRRDVLNLFNDAIATGKPVVIITDMFLPQKLIEKLLNENGYKGWNTLFVSNKVGARKDNGKLYEIVLSHFGIKPEQLIMIGDNERSDVQIPCDMKSSFLHVLQPVELARGLPRFAPLIMYHEQKADVDSEITLGLVVRKNFSPIVYPSFDPASLVRVEPYNWGYSIVGPLLVSFSEWLLQNSLKDNIEALYFLSREGKLMKEIFDCWCEGLHDVPLTDYLVLSRRAAGVAAINSFDDIVEIAKTEYFPNKVGDFLYTRFGIRLNDNQWKDIEEKFGWSRDTVVEVRQGNIKQLAPLLQFLYETIVDKTRSERQGLLAYLELKGMLKHNQQAVVDIGYGGSAQAYLNKLFLQKVDGYYLMTDYRANKVSKTFGVNLHGCFCENVDKSINAPIIFKFSFEVEKLLSSNEPQVEYYEMDSNYDVQAHYRELTKEEMAPAEIRNEIRRGTLDYTSDARQIRENVLHDFHPSCWTAQMLIETFLSQLSQNEKELFAKLALDDYYCGRGMVT